MELGLDLPVHWIFHERRRTEVFLNVGSFAPFGLQSFRHPRLVSIYRKKLIWRCQFNSNSTLWHVSHPTGLEKDEDSLLNKRTKERYGICKSRMITSSPFSAPIGEEHYQAYAPLSSSDCDHVRRVFGVDESREAGVPRWSTRYVGEKSILGWTTTAPTGACRTRVDWGSVILIN